MSTIRLLCTRDCLDQGTENGSWSRLANGKWDVENGKWPNGVEFIKRKPYQFCAKQTIPTAARGVVLPFWASQVPCPTQAITATMAAGSHRVKCK